MGGLGLKLAIGAFLVWLSAQMGTFAEEILTRVRESVQASELLEIDKWVLVGSEFDQNRKGKGAPRDQAEFERILVEWTTANGRDVSKDRWNEPYLYERGAVQNPISYRITSKGVDRRLGSEDDLVVERDGDRVAINRDPARIAEEALERKKSLDRETARRLREILRSAATTAPEAPPDRAELERATRELAKLLDEGP